MIVQEFGQLLAQALVALGLMAEQHGAFEQDLLQLVRQMAPHVRGRRTEREKIARGVFVGSRRSRRHRCRHGSTSRWVQSASGPPLPPATEQYRVRGGGVRPGALPSMSTRRSR